MDNSLILKHKTDIYNYLDNKHLKQAFLCLKNFIQELGEWRFSEKLEQLETSYRYMLRYMGEGFNDPDRDKLYRKLLADTYLLTDMVTDRFLQRSTSSVFYSKRRVLLSGTDSLEDIYKRLQNAVDQLVMAELVEDGSIEEQKKILHLRKETEDTAALLFNAIWTNMFPTAEELEVIRNIFESGSIPTEYQRLLTSALTMNLLSWHDEAKLSLLIDQISSDDMEINQRALVGTIFVLQFHTKRASTTKTIENQLNSLLENPHIVKRIRTIQLQFIRTRETERITKKLNEEILPEMMKMATPLYNKIKTDDILKDSDEQEMNPEWEEYLNKSDVGDKLKEISELQLEGSDVLMSAFANLKIFPFFQKISNWFLPFIQSNTEINNIFATPEQTNQFLDFVSKSRFLCNSDKYSFALSLAQMPDMQRKMMAEQFAAQGEELEQLNKIQDNNTLLQQEEGISNLYIQDLYRFFKLFPQHNEFRDPFVQDLRFYRIPMLKPLFSDIETLHILAEMFFRKEFYDDAAAVYYELTQLDHTRSDFFQKLGYCYQHLGWYEKAIQAYLQADIIHPDSLWTLRRLAQCYRNIKKTAEALTYYERFNSLKPGNLAVELNMGHCYLEMKDYENALTHYFKVDYLDPNNNKAWRPIAWCSFLIGKYEQARRYYNKILEGSPSSLDYINAAHTEWVIGDIRQAISYYRKGFELAGNDKEAFEKTFLQDKLDLLHAGIHETDFYLMIDQLLYASEEA